MQGLVLDAIYNILKFTLASTSPGLRRTLSKTTSTDRDYLQRVIAASKAHQEMEENKAAQDSDMASGGEEQKSAA